MVTVAVVPLSFMIMAGSLSCLGIRPRGERDGDVIVGDDEGDDDVVSLSDVTGDLLEVVVAFDSLALPLDTFSLLHEASKATATSPRAHESRMPIQIILSPVGHPMDPDGPISLRRPLGPGSHGLPADHTT
ncbi:hypothetical protein GCM10027298_30410 [Epidermidibacterium keratini]